MENRNSLRGEYRNDSDRVLKVRSIRGKWLQLKSELDNDTKTKIGELYMTKVLKIGEKTVSQFIEGEYTASQFVGERLNDITQDSQIDDFWEEVELLIDFHSKDELSFLTTECGPIDAFMFLLALDNIGMEENELLRRINRVAHAYK